MASQVTAKKQQGEFIIPDECGDRAARGKRREANKIAELQNQYSAYKSSLQQIAEKIGSIEQEADEHKYVFQSLNRSISSCRQAAPLSLHATA